MKLKADLERDCDPAIVEALESDEFDKRVVTEVLIRHLHMSPDVGPAEFYIQLCDFAGRRRGLFCEARLTGVSVNNRRAVDDFFNARKALERVYAETIHPLMKPGERRQLMISLMLDQPPGRETTSLIERSGKPAIWIEGGKPLPKM